MTIGLSGRSQSFRHGPGQKLKNTVMQSGQFLLDSSVFLIVWTCAGCHSMDSLDHGHSNYCIWLVSFSGIGKAAEETRALKELDLKSDDVGYATQVT